MAITQEFLSQCSDDQIDSGVAWLEASKADIKRHGFFISSRYYCNSVKMGCAMFPFKPCTNPNDIMSIAFANKFSIWPIARDTDTYRVSDFSGYNYVFNKNPLRAICECYILMMVAK